MYTQIFTHIYIRTHVHMSCSCKTRSTGMQECDLCAPVFTL